MLHYSVCKRHLSTETLISWLEVRNLQWSPGREQTSGIVLLRLTVQMCCMKTSPTLYYYQTTTGFSLDTKNLEDRFSTKNWCISTHTSMWLSMMQLTFIALWSNSGTLQALLEMTRYKSWDVFSILLSIDSWCVAVSTALCFEKYYLGCHCSSAAVMTSNELLTTFRFTIHTLLSMRAH